MRTNPDDGLLRSCFAFFLSLAMCIGLTIAAMAWMSWTEYRVGRLEAGAHGPAPIGYLDFLINSPAARNAQLKP